MAERHPGGRPTKYDPSYCQAVIDYCAKGYSLTAFAGHIRVARSTLNEWMEQFPEFSEAINIAKAARTSTLECEMLEAEIGPKVTARIFALKNAAPQEWREKQDIELSGKDGGAIETKTELSLDVARKVAFLLAKGEREAK